MAVFHCDLLILRLFVAGWRLHLVNPVNPRIQPIKYLAAFFLRGPLPDHPVILGLDQLKPGSCQQSVRSCFCLLDFYNGRIVAHDQPRDLLQPICNRKFNRLCQKFKSIRSLYLYKAVFSCRQVLRAMALLAGYPFIHRYPGKTLCIPCFFPVFICPLFNPQRNSCQQFPGIPKQFFSDHPIGIIGRIIFCYDQVCQFIFVFKLEFIWFQGHHMAFCCFCFFAYICIGLEISIGIHGSNRLGCKLRRPHGICGYLFTNLIQCLVHQLELGPLQLLAGVVCIALGYFKDPIRDLICHFHLLQDFGVRNGKWDIHGLQESIGRCHFPQDIIPLGYVFYKMGF